jgi:polysaccharide export outer membrane protein
MTRASKFLTLALAALLASGCAHSAGDYVWVDDYKVPRYEPPKDYIIAPGDQIMVRVYNQDTLTTKVRVRADGKITVPLLNDVQASGNTLAGLADLIQVRLKDFIKTPLVTVSLEEPRLFEIYVVGEVARTGRYALDPNSTVLQAIAAAGGLTELAGRDRIYVVRQDPGPVRIRFRYDSLTHLQGNAAEFRLKVGDTVVVE